MPRAWLDDTLDMHYELDDYTDPWTTPDTIYASTVLIQGPGKQGLCWRLAKSSWRHARFLTATANVDGWLSDFAGGRRARWTRSIQRTSSSWSPRPAATRRRRSSARRTASDA